MRRLFPIVGLAAILTAAAAGAQEPRLVLEGERAFMRNGCYGCHTVGRVGTPLGPDLSHIGAKYELSALHRWLTDPAAQKPQAHMPKLDLSNDDVNAVAAFLAVQR